MVQPEALTLKLRLFYICMLCLPLLAGARTIHAGKGRAISTVTAAIARAAHGDTVMIHPGLYVEGNIVVPKTICLIGNGWPVLDGNKRSEVLSVRAPSVVVSGFVVRRSGAASMDDPGAIKVYNTHDVTISGNVLDDNFFGIYILHGKRCTVSNNRITSYGRDEQAIGNGIHAWKSDSLLIMNNQITGHRDGIYFEFVTNSRIKDNIAERNVRYGLHFMFSHRDAYTHNVFRNNGAGVAVMFTRQVTMADNVFEENWGDAAYGLLLKEISDSEITGNKFVRNTSGIHMEGTSRILVERNVFASNGWGMKIQASCMDNEVRDNNFIANTFDIGTNGSLVLNTFNSNYWDKYEGYDLNKDLVGDVAYRPLSLFSVIVETNPPAMLLFRSFMVTLLDRSEKILPSLTPDNFIDNKPRMRRVAL
jgi:nitrous oxidase accessory protein